MIRVYTQQDPPLNPSKHDLWVRSTRADDIQIYNGCEFEPLDVNNLKAKTPITVSFNPESGVMMDLYVSKEHRMRIYDDLTWELIGGAHGEEEEQEQD